MLATPQTVTIDGTGHVLSRISEQGGVSKYRKTATGLLIDMNIRHSYEGGGDPLNRICRHNVELVKTTWTDGKPTVESVYLVMRHTEAAGPAPVILDGIGLLAWLSASSSARLTDIANWEV
jgi:hypothetical protein